MKSGLVKLVTLFCALKQSIVIISALDYLQRVDENSVAYVDKVEERNIKISSISDPSWKPEISGL